MEEYLWVTSSSSVATTSSPATPWCSSLPISLSRSVRTAIRTETSYHHNLSFRQSRWLLSSPLVLLLPLPERHLCSPARPWSLQHRRAAGLLGHHQGLGHVPHTVQHQHAQDQGQAQHSPDTLVVESLHLHGGECARASPSAVQLPGT